MSIKAIAAMAENRAIGKNGGLPWKPIKKDFSFFKDFTKNNTLVVGSNTYKTLPPLPGRKLIVASQNLIDSWYNPRNDTAMCALTFDEIRDIAKKQELVVIGGARIYETFLPLINEFYVTHVNGSYEADTFMPAFEHLFNNAETVKEFDGHRIVKYTKL